MNTLVVIISCLLLYWKYRSLRNRYLNKKYEFAMDEIRHKLALSEIDGQLKDKNFIKKMDHLLLASKIYAPNYNLFLLVLWRNRFPDKTERLSYRVYEGSKEEQQIAMQFCYAYERNTIGLFIQRHFIVTRVSFILIKSLMGIEKVKYFKEKAAKIIANFFNSKPDSELTVC